MEWTWGWWLALPVAVGVAMGLLYALSGFRDGAQADIAKNPRWTNLKWVGSVAGASLIGDWDKLSGATNVSKVAMTSIYVVSVIATAFVTIVLIAAAIYVDRRRTAAQPGRANRMTASQIALLYVQKGYPAYYEELGRDRDWVAQHAEHAEEEARRRGEARFVQRIRLQGCASYSLYVGGQIAAASSVDLQSRVDTLLSEMVSVAIQQTALDKNEFAINFMEAMPFAAGFKRFRDVTQFVFDPHERYESLLILKRYVGRGGGQDFGLPVHAHGPQARPLPGAPSVLFDGNSRYVQVDTFNKDFAKQLADAERRQIVGYLEKQPFACFLSLPIQWGGHRLGVVNIDCKTPRFGFEENPAELFATTLLPFCMLLGNVLSVANRKPSHDHKADG